MLGKMSQRLTFNRPRYATQRGSLSDRPRSKWVSPVFTVLAVVGALAIAPGQERAPTSGPPQPDPLRPSSQSSQATGRYYVKFRPGTKPAERAALAVQHGARVLHNYSFTDAIAIAVINENALNGLSRSNSVLQILPDQVIQLAAAPAPKAPENLAANVSALDVTLTWTQKGKVDTYNVERCDGGGPSCSPFIAVATGLPKDPKSYTDTVPAIGAYAYRVIAFVGTTPSPPSSPVDANVIGGGSPPPAPTNLSATPSGSNVDLAWDDVAGETGYNIQFCTT